jgi:DNA repair photolyase
MISKRAIVISASRRTDIPAFYMPWFMEGIDAGFFEVVNPYNRRRHRVPAEVGAVHSIVFWSKNLAAFLDGDFGRKLQRRGFRLYFNFTINSESLLEPHVPPLASRLEQLQRLCERFGAEAVTWRFDPICFFHNRQGERCNNLHDFATIGRQAAACGVTRCITSFVDLYPKVTRRLMRRDDVRLFDPPLEEKIETLLALEAELKRLGIRLHTCCEKKLQAALPAHSTVAPAACIPHAQLMKLYGGRLSLKKDRGQRTGAGCGCQESADIGSYHLHPCRHRCLYCYANPAASATSGGPKAEEKSAAGEAFGSRGMRP